MHIRYVKPGMIVASDIFDDKGTLLLEKGITLTASYIERLQSLRIETLRIVDPEATALKTPVISPKLRSELKECFRSLFQLKTQNMLTEKVCVLHLHQLPQTTGTIIDEIKTKMPVILNLEIRQTSPEEVDHAVNVCLLSLVTGLYIKLPDSMLHDLVAGALLHDIGKAANAKNHSFASGQSVLHPLYGEKLLNAVRQSYAVCRIAAEHHEAYDGTGYPSRLAGKAIHPLARIVAVANYYDNAIHTAQQTGSSRQDIVEDMLGKGNTLFDLNTLRAFFHTTAVYPVGSLVLLSNGQTGHVIKNYAQYPLRPLVRLNSIASAAEVSLMYKQNLTITAVLSE